MDDQQKNDNQDLTMNMDGTMTTDQGQKIEVTSAPVVNDIEPPTIGETEIKAESDDEEVANDGVATTPEPSNTAEPVQSEPLEIAVAGENTSAEPQSLPEESSSPVPTTSQETTPTENAIEDQATLAKVGVAMSQARDKSQHVHHNNKKIALVVTLVTAVLLAGLAVYVYLSANNAAEPTTLNTNNQSQTTTDTAATPATPEDVDIATQGLDSAIESVDAAADFDESELSDQSLGL